MRLGSIALKDLRQIARDRKSVLFLLLMPLGFTVFFGLAYRSLTSPGGDDAVPVVGVANEDDGHLLTGYLLEFLRDSPALRLEELGPGAGPEEVVENGAVSVAVTIPAGFGAALQDGSPLPLDVVAQRDTPAGRAALAALDASVGRFLGAVRIAALAQEASDAGPGGQEVAEAAARQAALAAARSAWRDPPIVTSEERAGTDGAAKAATNPYAQASPGMIVQFAIYGLILSAMLLVLERKTGALARLVGTPATRTELIGGHVLAMFVVVLLQIAVLVVFGQVVLGVDSFAHPTAILLTSAALAVWSASLGLLIGSLSRSEDHVIVGSLISMFVFSAFGGAWFPLEVTGRAFSAVGHLTPGAWAMDAYQSVVLRDQGLLAVLVPVSMLLGFALLFFAIATWRFRPEG